MIEHMKNSAGVSPLEADRASNTQPHRAEVQRPRAVLLASARRSLAAWFRVAVTAAGLSLAVSPDGLHALMTAVRNPPELIILDDDLEGVDADLVEEMLSRDARTATTPIMHVR